MRWLENLRRKKKAAQSTTREQLLELLRKHGGDLDAAPPHVAEQVEAMAEAAGVGLDELEGVAAAVAELAGIGDLPNLDALRARRKTAGRAATEARARLEGLIAEQRQRIAAADADVATAERECRAAEVAAQRHAHLQRQLLEFTDPAAAAEADEAADALAQREVDRRRLEAERAQLVADQRLGRHRVGQTREGGARELQQQLADIDAQLQALDNGEVPPPRNDVAPVQQFDDGDDDPTSALDGPRPRRARRSPSRN